MLWYFLTNSGERNANVHPRQDYKRYNSMFDGAEKQRKRIEKYLIAEKSLSEIDVWL